MVNPGKAYGQTGFTILLCATISSAMKSTINYLWKNRLFPDRSLRSADGKEIHIISNGKESADGNIFTGCRIKAGNELWTGDIILHSIKENKSPDTATENRAAASIKVTIDGCAHGQDGRTLIIAASLPAGMEEFHTLAEQQRNIPCQHTLPKITALEQHSYMSRLLVERIEEKSSLLEETLAQCGGKWNDALTRTIIRSFGFGIQSRPFGELAETVDTHALEKHRDNLLQIEAILFGQAGLLEEEGIPHYYLTKAKNERYYNELAREFRFLRNKFGLKLLDGRIWDSNYTPHVRIARLAQMYHDRRIDVSRIIDCRRAADHHRLLDTVLSGYWSNHTCIGGVETSGNGGMNKRHLDTVIINAIVPIIYLWGKRHGQEHICGRAEEMLHLMNCEENSIVKRWRSAGARMECAADSQAILQLDKKYCRQHRCAECRFAYYHIKHEMANI